MASIWFAVTPIGAAVWGAAFIYGAIQTAYACRDNPPKDKTYRMKEPRI